MIVQIPYVILEKYVQIGKKLQVILIFFTHLLYFAVRKTMTFNIWIMTMKYHSKKV